ncbi:MAG: GNAT family N-acetyltransferase [Acidobacteriota bacterium]|nr:GNAT family N-acetyltransferase [Acidobacteriota bacterium]MDE3043947.1 GNAT family N-acetyltransferase [Acidobacteriota bacterium]MDE3223112.1 GNAT family N-acetyltransferase [Acidobacteriota bacterium]
MSARAVYSPVTLHGRRVILRTLGEHDYEGWHEVRVRCRDWLVKWEPRSAHSSHLPEDQRSFVSRCALRERERQLGTGYGFGIFVDQRFVGEITLSSIQRGPLQSAFIGYWIDEAVAGRGLMPESVITLLQYAFESLRLHRIEINIIPRNAASRRVVEKLGIRFEGIAERYLEIDGAWEDHARYAITAEEWADRAPELVTNWLLPLDN